MKWWGNDKSETWVYKQGNDWWMMKPSRKIKDARPRPQNKKRTEEERQKVNWRQVLLSSLFGALIGTGAFFLFLTYFLIKNAL